MLKKTNFWRIIKKTITKLLIFASLSTSWGKILEDFDQGTQLGDSWIASEGMLLKKMVIADDDSYEGVKGHKLKVNSVAGGYFASKSSFPAPRFAASSAIKFRIKGILNKYGKFLPVPIEFDGETINNTEPIWTKSPNDLKS